MSGTGESLVSWGQLEFVDADYVVCAQKVATSTVVADNTGDPTTADGTVKTRRCVDLTFHLKTGAIIQVGPFREDEANYILRELVRTKRPNII